MADNERCTLSGTIHRDALELKGDIHLEKGISGALPGTLVFYIAEDIPQYNGPSEVIPSRQEQILQTAGKYLPEDIKVKEIPDGYVDTSGANALPEHIAKNYTAWVNGKLVTGTFTIADEITEQQTLITQIRNALIEKGADIDW